MFCWEVDINIGGELKSVLVQTQKESLLKSLPAIGFDYNEFRFLPITKEMIVAYKLFALAGKKV